MKNIILFTLLSIQLFGTELHWLHDYDKALHIAKEQNKGVYIFIGADRCRFCNILKDKTFSKKSVMQRLEKDFIPVYLSRDQHKVPSQFSTKSVPRHYFVTNDGKIFYEDRGSREESGFHLLLDEVELSQIKE